MTITSESLQDVDKKLLETTMSLVRDVAINKVLHLATQ
jgi:hypothetical protein